eukprot:365867-Chlamydomonas_euryale.AAC.2
MSKEERDDDGDDATSCVRWRYDDTLARVFACGHEISAMNFEKVMRRIDAMLACDAARTHVELSTNTSMTAYVKALMQMFVKDMSQEVPGGEFKTGQTLTELLELPVSSPSERSREASSRKSIGRATPRAAVEAPAGRR